MDEIDKAVKILNEGGIIIYPTDTAFGIGCRMDRQESIRRLFKIRKRPINQATPVLISSIDMAKNYVEGIPEDVQKIMEEYWPGALTIVLSCKTDKVPTLVRGGSTTVGLRIPNHGVPLSVIAKAKVPLLGPSANFHGEPTPFSTIDLNPELTKLVDFVIRGETRSKQASTVIDCSSRPFKVLRQGAVEVGL